MLVQSAVEIFIFFCYILSLLVADRDLVSISGGRVEKKGKAERKKEGSYPLAMGRQGDKSAQMRMQLPSKGTSWKAFCLFRYFFNTSDAIGLSLLTFRPRLRHFPLLQLFLREL